MDPRPLANLDPELAEVVAMFPDMGGALDDVAAARAGMSGFTRTGPPPGEDELEISDEMVPVGGGAPDVLVRMYRPRERTPEPLPGLLDLHGGGFCLGSAEMEHANAVRLASELGVVVANVDYRLAPEDPYPAGLEDCYAALLHLASRPDVDPQRIGVHGQSAGGGLAAATALLARDRGGPALCVQVLGIPELDDRLDTPSMRAFADTPLWSRPQAARSWEYYLGGRAADQYAAPARAEDLSGLPPAYVVTCELDPMRDEGLTYAMRLLAAGVSVEVHNFPGAFHGATIVPGAQVVRRMEAELLTVLRRRLWGDATMSR